MLQDPLSNEALDELFQVSLKYENRIAKRESAVLEFKESYSPANMAQYFKAMASFANNSGGYIIFGIGDSPRELIGLSNASLKKFEGIKIEVFTKNLLDYFSPEIKWDLCTYMFRDQAYGVIYTYELNAKPCICKKTTDSKDKSSLKEEDIYYRYSGRSERIKYEQLNEIITDRVQAQDKKWFTMFNSIAKIGIDEANVLSLKDRTINTSKGRVVIDQNVIDKLSFIKEGEFNEVKGKPTLRLIGDIEAIEKGKYVFQQFTKRVVKAIEPNNIVLDFLRQENVDNPTEYIKRICSATTGFFPCYYYIYLAEISKDEALELIEKTTARGNAKRKLVERLSNMTSEYVPLKKTNTQASQYKHMYRDGWINENIEENIEHLGYCMQALRSLTHKEILEHREYILKKMEEIYLALYELSDSTGANEIRRALCRIDEALFAEMN